ncbi:MAG: hypothetical protein WCM76_01180 [Bacteroidota bacterium]
MEGPSIIYNLLFLCSRFSLENSYPDISRILRERSAICELKKIGSSRSDLKSAPHYIWTSSFRIDKTYGIQIKAESELQQSFDEGDPVFFKFADGSSMVLSCFEANRSECAQGDASQWASQYIFYNRILLKLTKEQAAYLSKNDLRYVACGFKKYYINRPEEIKQQFHVVNGFS